MTGINSLNRDSDFRKKVKPTIAIMVSVTNLRLGCRS